MILMLLIFFIFLFILHLVFFCIKDADLLEKARYIIEYIWLIGAFSGIVFGFFELNRIEKTKEIQDNYTLNWYEYNLARSKIITINSDYSDSTQKEKEEYRWVNLLWQELERGYDNKLWQSMIFSNHDRIIPKTEYSSVSLAHSGISHTKYILDTSKVSKYFIKDITPIVISLTSVKNNWKSPVDIQKELGVRSKFELFLRKIIPYILFLILALRITNIQIGRRLTRLKAV